MGTFRYTVEIGDARQQSFQDVELWVDTGATYTWLPRDLLEALGYIPTFRRQFRLADGRAIEGDLCWIQIRLDGEVQPTPCVFGDEGSEPLLGAVTLETFSLEVEPVNRKLIPVLANALNARAAVETGDGARLALRQAQGERRKECHAERSEASKAYVGTRHRSWILHPDCIGVQNDKGIHRSW